jgi:hypothetical protein
MAWDWQDSEAFPTFFQCPAAKSKCWKNRKSNLIPGLGLIDFARYQTLSGRKLCVCASSAIRTQCMLSVISKRDKKSCRFPESRSKPHTIHVFQHRHVTEGGSLRDYSTEVSLPSLGTHLHRRLPVREGWPLQRSSWARRLAPKRSGAPLDIKSASPLKTMTAERKICLHLIIMLLFQYQKHYESADWYNSTPTHDSSAGLYFSAHHEYICY